MSQGQKIFKNINQNIKCYTTIIKNDVFYNFIKIFYGYFFTIELLPNFVIINYFVGIY